MYHEEKMYLRLGYDIRTGKELPHLARVFKHRGPIANAMPNVRLKSVPTNDQLNNVVTPIAPGQPEGIAWTWFDTANYVSTTTTQLDFFQTVQTDSVLGNMQAAGQLPNPMFFQLYHLMVYIQIPPTTVFIADNAAPVAIQTGAVNDVRRILDGSLSLQIADKTYYQSKIHQAPGGTGPYVSQATAGTFAASDSNVTDFATNGVPDIRNRNCFWGLIVIPPTQRFLVRMNWTAALTLISTPLPIVCSLDGYLFRRVL